MGRTVIKVRNLGKRYRIGLKEELHDSLIGGIASWVTSPFVNFRKLRRLSNFKSNDERDDIIWAVRDISFDLGEGEILGIIGHNGAGKTTLLKILSRIVEPTTGKAIIHGRVSSLLEVGTGFHPELTGRENIYLNGTILGMSKLEISNKLDEIIAFSEIEKFIDTPVKRYSSGMYVRLAFAVAAHLEPEILIVDEVLAVGDVQFRRKCLGKMSDVAETGRTVIFVSHNMGAIHKLCTRAIMIKDGMIEDDGKVEEIISKYVNPNLSEMQSSMTLPGAEGNSPGHGLRLTFMDLNNIEKNLFNMGEIWKIQFDFEILRNTPHVSAAVGPRNVDASIKTFRTKPVDLKAGFYRAEFKFNIPVKSTELQFAVGLTTNETTFYYYHNAGHVRISEIYKGKKPIRTKDSGLLIDDEFEEIVPIS